MAPEPWQYNGNERVLDGYVGLTAERLKETGLEINKEFSSVDRVGKKDLYMRLPDHVGLPAYDDKFITKNDSKIARDLSAGFKKPSLNDLKWLCNLRMFKKSGQPKQTSS